MDIISKDTHVMELARRSARAFCANHHPWGMGVDDVYSRILEFYAAAEEHIVRFAEGSKDREDAAKATIAYALNVCRDESKANRARLQPYQVRKAYERGEDIDKAYRVLGEDFALFFSRDDEDIEREKALYAAIEKMPPRFRRYCKLYLDFETWREVARICDIDYDFFRHRLMPAMRKVGERIWKTVWESEKDLARR